MKTLITSTFLAFITTMSFAQASSTTDNAYSAKGTTVKFDSLIINYGDIEQGTIDTRSIGFTNTGKRELLFSNCSANADYIDVTCPVEAIRPGQSGSIKITYAANSLGKMNKSVDLVTNTPMNTITVKMKSTVVPSAAPTVGEK